MRYPKSIESVDPPLDVSVWDREREMVQANPGLIERPVRGHRMLYEPKLYRVVSQHSFVPRLTFLAEFREYRKFQNVAIPGDARGQVPNGESDVCDASQHAQTLGDSGILRHCKGRGMQRTDDDTWYLASGVFDRLASATMWLAPEPPDCRN
jgi:hypothetical protein